MQAVLLGSDGVEHLGDIPDPSPAAGEVVVRVDYCGICGSDLHASAQGFSAGVALGHEFAGVIVELGREVDNLSVGDRVCVNPNGDWCGRCAFCRAGQFNLCTELFRTAVGVARHGGMAPYAAVPTKVLHRLPEGVSTRQGAWVEPLATALRGVRRSGIGMGDDVLVSGAGPIGLLIIALLRAMGTGRITVLEPTPARAAKAVVMGADTVIDPLTADLGGVFDDPAKAPAYGFEASGVPAAIETALRVLRPRGVLTVTGVAPRPPHYQAPDLVFKEITIRGSFIYEQEFAMAIDLLDRGVVDIDPLISRIAPVDAGLQAFTDLRGGADIVKVLLSAEHGGGV
ncbi:zinc-dependent alcohol dehydrogenase [Mycobacterium sp. C31M]